MLQPILVTGATGNVGQEIIKNLYNQQQSVRAAVVSDEASKRLPVPVEWVRFDFRDASTYRATFAGVKKVFLVRPPHISNIERDMKPAIDYAVKAGVEHIAFLSLLGAEKNRVVPHAKIENLLQAGSVNYTLLRCGFFMQNLSTTHRQDIKEHNDIFIPAGRGKTAFIDVRDIAAVAVKTLTETGHEQQAYPLTGGEALDYYQVAEIMSQCLGRSIVYGNPSLLRFFWRFWRRGYPVSYIGVVSTIYMTTRFGLAQTVTPRTQQLLGRAPISLKQFVQDYATVWTKDKAHL
ncbi:MAG: SDR family oxidoreductase [Caldilineaceae bacterium]|nr:SDR family oxidoreductase [Caldilineaceae bacterium]